MSLSPQERWALKNYHKGRCTRCGRKRNHYKRLCDYCQAKQSMYMKNYRDAVKKAQEVKQKILSRNGVAR